jgi:hypothetical protein
LEGGRKRTGNSDAVSDPEGFALDNEAKFKHGLEAYKKGMDDYKKGLATGDADLQAKGLAEQADGLKTVARSASKAGEAAGIKPKNPAEGSTWSKADGLRNYKDPPELGISDVGDSMAAENAKVINDFFVDAEKKLNEAKEKLTKLGRETTDEARAAAKEALENAKVADPRNEHWNKEGAGVIEQRRQRVRDSNQARAERNAELKNVRKTFPENGCGIVVAVGVMSKKHQTNKIEMTAVVEQIISNVLKNDADPPSDDYSAYDYGARATRGFDEMSASLLIIESFRRLPASLAESFIEGILDQIPVLQLNDTLFSALPQVCDVTSAATIARLVASRGRIPRLNILMRLFSGMRQTAHEHEQNAYAYAIWTTLGDRHSTDGTVVPVSRENAIIDGLIEDMLDPKSRVALTDYSRGTLERCRRGRRS